MHGSHSFTCKLHHVYLSFVSVRQEINRVDMLCISTYIIIVMYLHKLGQ